MGVNTALGFTVLISVWNFILDFLLHLIEVITYLFYKRILLRLGFVD